MMLLNKVVNEVDRQIRSVAYRYPKRVRCNVCGWAGRSLVSDSWHPNTICPRCCSQVRHRLLFAALQRHPELNIEQLVGGKRVLHFAPERFFPSYLKPAAEEYVTADYVKKRSLDLQLDMCDLSSLANESFDLVIACDVLEHVPNDEVALGELRRILSANGWAILTVPQVDDMPTKREDPSITTPEGREQAFGQVDHLRIYGQDFEQFLADNGFDVTVVSSDDFEPSVVEEHVLFPPVLSQNPLATNYRKVFFARKTA